VENASHFCEVVVLKLSHALVVDLQAVVDSNTFPGGGAGSGIVEPRQLPNHTMEYGSFVPQIFEGYVTKFAPHKALKSIA